MKNFFFFLLFTINIFAQSYDFEFYNNGKYNNNIPKPIDVLGYNIGEKPISHIESVIYLKALAEKSPRVKLLKEGKTHQGRDLYYLIVSSEKNINNLEKIKSNLADLADPRKTNESSANKIIDDSPMAAYMMYSIHGNETSGSDASMQLLYQLAAGVDEKTNKLLDELVIIIYPMENPDGRERFLSQLNTWRGKVINSDVQSLPHNNTWPSGRTNHYHFDLNRDWFILSQPESKSRVKILNEWNPQLVVDAHEMGSGSSFLFNPPREPINPNMHQKIKNWWGVFANDQAKAFDNYGWSYYTREWLEEWYPGYGSSYPSYSGAVSILYEQARTAGLEVKRSDNTVLTFREAVHHQFIASLANLNTAADNRKKMLNDFYQIKKEAVSKYQKNDVKTFIIENDENKFRINLLLEKLIYQGIEVFETKEDKEISNAKGYWDKNPIRKKIAKGSFVIPLKQPKQYLINAILEFDTRMTNKYLKSERESLEKGNGTRLYEVSSWSMPLAYGLNVYTSKEEINVKMEKIESIEKMEANLYNPNPNYGYLIKFTDDNVYKVLKTLFDKNIIVRSAQKDFKVENNFYEKGTLLIRKFENPNFEIETLEKIVSDFGIDIVGVNTALSQSGYDLGGDYFDLLRKPKVAIFTGLNISVYNFGVTWFLLDDELKMRTSLLHFDNIDDYDLRKYNTIIIPSFWGSANKFKTTLGKSGVKKINDWVKSGGTLIAINTSAAALADTSIGISNVKLRRQSLTKLKNYELSYEREKNILDIEVDSLEIWEGKKIKNSKNGKIDSDKKLKLATKQLEELDSYNRRFMPYGTILNVKLNSDHWLNFGIKEKIPALYSSRFVFLAKEPVEIAARFSEKENLRLSGLIWPEAKERIEKSAYLTRESSGNGQIILFAFEPNFRTLFKGTQKMLLNSIFLGSGLGTNQGIDW